MEKNADLKYNIDTLNACKRIITKRGLQYENDCFIITANIASAISGKLFTPEDVGLLLIANKLARYTNISKQMLHKYNKNIQKTFMDTVIDAANYIILMSREKLKYDKEKVRNKTRKTKAAKR